MSEGDKAIDALEVFESGSEISSFSHRSQHLDVLESQTSVQPRVQPVPMSERALPIELLHLIFRECNRRSDLAVLSRVSSTFQIVAETWLYQSLARDVGRDDYVGCILAMLERPRRAAYLHSLQSFADKQANPKRRHLLPKLLQIASNLRSLSIFREDTWSDIPMMSGITQWTFNLVYIAYPDHYMWATQFREWLPTQTRLEHLATVWHEKTDFMFLTAQPALDLQPIHLPNLKTIHTRTIFAPIFAQNPITSLEVDSLTPGTALHDLWQAFATQSGPPVVSRLEISSPGNNDWPMIAPDIARLVASLPALTILVFENCTLEHNVQRVSDSQKVILVSHFFNLMYNHLFVYSSSSTSPS